MKMFVKKIVEFCIVFKNSYKNEMLMWKSCSSQHANLKKIEISKISNYVFENVKIMLVATCKFQNEIENFNFLAIHIETKNQQKVDWRTLMIDETYVFERFKKLIAIRNVMISKQIYDEKIAKFLVDLISQMLFQKFFVVSLRKRLIISNEIDEH